MYIEGGGHYFIDKKQIMKIIAKI